MVDAAVIFICAWICSIDIRSYRIPNKLTLSLAFLLLIDSVTAQLLEFLVASALTLLIAYVGKIGAGDVKLFLVLIATSGSLVLSQQYFLGMALVSICLLLASFFNMRRKGIEALHSIAFAPSILIPFLALYLAI